MNRPENENPTPKQKTCKVKRRKSQKKGKSQLYDSPLSSVFKSGQLRVITNFSPVFLLSHSTKPSILDFMFLSFHSPDCNSFSSSLMGLHFRKLLSEVVCSEVICKLSNESESPSSFSYCEKCAELDHPITSVHHKTKKFLLAIIVVLATTFLLACCYALYVKFYARSRRRRRRGPQEQQRIETHDEFVDEDHGPVLDHPIWYINTIGLQPSVISSIAVCKYKRGDGLVEGTECSVCLNEFQDDETLRLLPKCNHAFHIPCIDTWLRSHTNCPLCRAPIVTNAAEATSSEANVDNSTTQQETQIGVLENDTESDREMEGGDSEVGIGMEEEGELQDENRRNRCEDFLEEEDGIQPMRRSVSLDSLSAFKISQALGTVLPMESDQNSGTQQPVKENGSIMAIIPKRIGGNQSLLQFMASSSIGRSLQIGPSSLKRSLSCSGKLFLSRYNRNRSRNSVLPS